MRVLLAYESAVTVLQVRTAFIAGVVLCVALVPINRLIAQKIQVRNTQHDVVHTRLTASCV